MEFKRAATFEIGKGIWLTSTSNITDEDVSPMFNISSFVVHVVRGDTDNGKEETEKIYSNSELASM